MKLFEAILYLYDRCSQQRLYYSSGVHHLILVLELEVELDMVASLCFHLLCSNVKCTQ